MSTPRGNLGGGKANLDKVNPDPALQTKEEAGAVAAVATKAAVDAAVGFVPTMAAEAPEGATLAELKAFAISKQAEAYNAGKAAALVERSGDEAKTAEARALKTTLDGEATAAFQRYEAARKAEKDAAVEAEAKLKAKNDRLAFQRKEAYHAASQILMDVKAKVEAEFKAIEATMTAKRAEIAALEKNLRRGHNLAEWNQFDAAVDGVKKLVEAEG